MRKDWISQSSIEKTFITPTLTSINKHDDVYSSIESN